MEKRRTSQPENQKDVYKFWLGLFEKATLVFLTVIGVPLIIGQIEYSLLLLLLTTGVILALFALMIYLSFKLWYLPKKFSKSED